MKHFTAPVACVLCALSALSSGSADQQVNRTDTKPAPKTKVLYKPYSLVDQQAFTGMEIVRGVLPQDWSWKGGLSWRSDLVQPDQLRLHWGDSKDVRAFDVYPYVSFAWSSDAEQGLYRRGQVVLGAIVEPVPADVFQALEGAMIARYRPELAKAQVINKERLPEVAQKLYKQYNTDPNNELLIGVGKETFEYELNGRTVQEVVSGVFSATRSRFHNPKGVTYWSVSYGSSERAAKGELESLAPLKAVMVESLQVNQAWKQRVALYVEQRKAQILAGQKESLDRQKAQFDAIERRIAAQGAANEAQHKSYWAHTANLALQSENRADVMREVSPWKTGDGTTCKLPSQYGQAWSSASGEILMNNDPGYNPNSDPSLTPTQWTQMEPTHN